MEGFQVLEGEVFAACRLRNLSLLTNSVFSVERKCSARALSGVFPVLSIDGVMPTSLSLSEKEGAAYWAP